MNQPERNPLAHFALPDSIEDQMDQSEYWDRVAEKKNFTTPFHMEEFSKVTRTEDRILDYGCGYGRTLAELKDAGYRNLTGVDSSPMILERGSREHPDLTLFLMNHNYIPFDNNSFDAVLLLAVLTCVPRDSDQLQIMGEIQRVLRPGGVLYINDFMINSDERNRQRYAKAPAGFPYGVFTVPEGCILRHHTREWIQNLTRPFDTILYQEEEFETMNGHTGWGFCFMGRTE